MEIVSVYPVTNERIRPFYNTVICPRGEEIRQQVATCVSIRPTSSDHDHWSFCASPES